jgi:hypothetical protein
MSLQIHEKLKTDLSNLLSEAAVKLKSGEDFRKCLAQLHSIDSKFEAILHLSDPSRDQNTPFASYLVLNQLRMISAAYEGGAESWYQLNAENIKSFRRHLSHYLNRLSRDISDSNFNALIEDTKNFFYAFHNHARCTNLKRSYKYS